MKAFLIDTNVLLLLRAIQRQDATLRLLAGQVIRTAYCWEEIFELG